MARPANRLEPEPPTAHYHEELGLSADLVERCSAALRSDERYLVARNAVTAGDAQRVALNRDSVLRLPMTFSTDIASGEITAQKQSGRCWAFAALNRLRLDAMKRMNVKTFELSESYVMFWDKLEKANYFLNNVIETANEAADSRLVAWLLANPIQDGGQWDMFVNLVTKYGLVPKDLYPESVSSSATRIMNLHVTEKLREFAAELRASHAAGVAPPDLHRRREAMLGDVYRMLAIHNAEPPRAFRWAWRDKDGAYHEHDGAITPREFLDEYVGFEFDAYASLIHCPTPDKPFDRLYTVEYLGNVADGSPVRYLNVDMPALKGAVLETLKSQEAVWFGCDVGKQLEREHGLLDEETYRFDLLYNLEFGMDKGTRVSYGHSRMTHAMLLTGVHEEDGNPVRWKVENSWGKEAGREGFLIMSDSWFDEYLFQVVVPKRFLAEHHIARLDVEPIVLKPWDPMGSLARGLNP